MKRAELMQQIRGMLNPHDKAARDQLSVFLVCLLISAFVWLLMSLNREYYSTLDYKLQISGLPSDKILMNKPGDHLLLRVRGQGYDLAELDFFSPKRSVTIDVRDIKLTEKKNGDYTAYLLTSPYATSIARQLKLSDELTGVSPDTLFFRFREKMQKKVPVRAPVEFTLDRQFWLSGPLQLNPDSIILKGLQSVLDTIDFVQSSAYQFGQINDSVAVKLPITEYSLEHPLELSSDSVLVTVPVEQFTEVRLEVDIHPAEIDSVEYYRFFPNKVNLFCQVSFRDYKRVDGTMFLIAAEKAKQESSEAGFARLKVLRKPDFVKNLRMEPEIVEYLQIRK